MRNLKRILLVVCCLLLITGCGNVKLKNGENAAVTFKDEEGISSDELYNELKKKNGAETLINMIDTYLLEKEYDTTSDEKDYIKEIITSVKEYATHIAPIRILFLFRKSACTSAMVGIYDVM